MSKDAKPLLKAPLRCSFCNKSQRDVSKLVAGPAVQICNECVEICVDVLEEDGILEPGLKTAPDSVPSVAEPRSALAPVYCVLCQMLTPVEHAVLFPERGWLCSPCMVVVELYLESREAES
jgi:hypothetical protein